MSVAAAGAAWRCARLRRRRPNLRGVVRRLRDRGGKGHHWKDNQAGRVYELAGDTAFTMTELAAEIERQAGKPVRYQNLPEADYRQALVGVGLPEPVAAMLAESDTGISKAAVRTTAAS